MWIFKGFVFLFDLFTIIKFYFYDTFEFLPTFPQNIHNFIHSKNRGCPPLRKIEICLENKGFFVKNKKVVHLSTTLYY